MFGPLEKAAAQGGTRKVGYEGSVVHVSLFGACAIPVRRVDATHSEGEDLLLAWHLGRCCSRGLARKGIASRPDVVEAMGGWAQGGLRRGFNKSAAEKPKALHVAGG